MSDFGYLRFLAEALVLVFAFAVIALLLIFIDAINNGVVH